MTAHGRNGDGLPVRFADRARAGRALAQHLRRYAKSSGVVVLGLPRGGVPVAFEVACILEAPLDVFVVRKLGVPEQPELAIGAVASGDVLFVNARLVDVLGLTPPDITRIVDRERAELQRRDRLYRGDRPIAELRDRVVILVDDGLATGASMRAAITAARVHGPARIVVAVPVAAHETCRDLESEADEVVCAITPEPFNSLSQWYRDFSQTTDREVLALLQRARDRTRGT